MRLLHYRKLQPSIFPIDAVEQHANAHARTIAPAAICAADFARVLAVAVAVVRQRMERHQALNKQLAELNEEAVLRDRKDDGVEVFADSIFHEFQLLGLDQFALCVRSPALGLARLLTDCDKFAVLIRSGEVAGRRCAKPLRRTSNLRLLCARG